MSTVCSNVLASAAVVSAVAAGCWIVTWATPADGAVPFRLEVIDASNPTHPHCKAAGDIDGDGLPDLLAASAAGDGLFWYRYPQWSKHKIASGGFTTDMAVADIDGDGHLDVIIPSGKGLMWYRNPRGAGKDPAKDPWTEHNISPQGANMHDVSVAHLDGDGRLDVVTRHQSGFGKRRGNQIHLWVQTKPDQWRHRTLDCPHGEGLHVSDLNRDGRPDVIIGGRWYENPGDVLAGQWQEHRYIDDAQFDGNWTAGDVVVCAGDINGDGRLDIAIAPAEGKGRLAWLAAPADPRQTPWTEHVIEPKTDHMHALALGDIDGDGLVDMATAKMHQASAPQEVAVYFNRQKGARWEKQVLATTGSHNIVLVDVGADGAMDIFGANWNNNSPTKGRLELWRNGRKPAGR